MKQIEVEFSWREYFSAAAEQSGLSSLTVYMAENFVKVRGTGYKMVADRYPMKGHSWGNPENATHKLTYPAGFSNSYGENMYATAFFITDEN